MEKKRSEKTLAVLELITGIGIILFWIGFFTVGLAPANPPDGYFVYEHSFPLPDAVLALTLIIAAVLLLRGRALGRTLSLAAAGGLVFLGVIDFSFNVQIGLYALWVVDGLLNGVMNHWCAAFGVFLVVRFAR